MNLNEAAGNVKVVISGTFECRDKDGVLLKTIELKGELPLSDLIETTKEDHGTQLGE